MKMSLQKKIILLTFSICTFLVGASLYTSSEQTKVASQFKNISVNQFPKVEKLSKLVATFRLIRIKVRTLGITGNDQQTQIQYRKETLEAIQDFLKLNEEFHQFNFDQKEREFVAILDKGWDEFYAFGGDLLSKYKNPTQENLEQGAYMIREICPIKAKGWMETAEKFLDYQSTSTQTEVMNAVAREKVIIRNSNIIMIAISLASLIFGFFFSKGISQKISVVADFLRNRANEFTSQSQRVSENSEKINSTTNESAAALQETAASINEISSMIQRNATASEESKKASNDSTRIANEGKQTIEEMLIAVNDISSGNKTIAQEIQANNQEITKIVTMISEIGEKTKVINDIAFQTKLLSFNASVEAARAGENGRGFAVVAEEVGNLATTSGAAAHEITEMLSSSINQVHSIVDKSKSKIDALIDQNNTKIEAGLEKADQCDQVLSEILKYAVEVNTMVEEIASASQEQSRGVTEVTTAINQLDTITQQNSTLSRESSAMAQDLSGKSMDLLGVINNLSSLVHGEGNSENSIIKYEEMIHQEAEIIPLNRAA